jgi:hypothetical protein
MGGQSHRTSWRIHIFFMEKGMRTMNYIQDFLHKRIISSVKGVELFSDKVS